MSPLTPAQVRTAMASLPHWSRRKSVIHREFTFANFVAAMEFVNAVAEAAEEACHHPDIDIRWNRVRLALTTHDAGGLTERDLVMAARCDALVTKRPGPRPRR